MLLTLTLWQRKMSGFPTRAGQGRLEEPSVERFNAAIVHLMTMVEPNAKPFQIVVQVGDSSRGFQLDQDWSVERIAAELWNRYTVLVGVNG